MLSAMRVGAAFTRWEHRYGLVLLLILCSLVLQLAASDDDGARLAAIALQGATLILALYASEVRPLVARLTTGIVALAVLGSAAALIGFGELGTTAGRVVAVLLIAFAPIAIATGVIRGVRTEGAVTVHTMFGVLCIYLLIGMLFAWAYGLVGDAQSGSFFASGIDADISDYLYFSFATLTTVGYGDLSAATDLGRSVAITEALIGQIYLVTVVAVIVGGLSRRRA
jgi:Ion channel